MSQRPEDALGALAFLRARSRIGGQCYGPDTLHLRLGGARYRRNRLSNLNHSQGIGPRPLKGLQRRT
jgi:hypothetical protein